MSPASPLSVNPVFIHTLLPAIYCQVHQKTGVARARRAHHQPPPGPPAELFDPRPRPVGFLYTILKKRRRRLLLLLLLLVVYSIGSLESSDSINPALLVIHGINSIEARTAPRALLIFLFFLFFYNLFVI